MAFGDGLSAAPLQTDDREIKIVNNFCYLDLGAFCDGKVLEDIKHRQAS